MNVPYTLPNPMIAVRSLSKSYGAVHAVRDLELAVPRGSIFGLLGPNGAGKSTTFGILCGWLTPSAGEVEIMGTAPCGLFDLRGRVAALPQDAAFPRQIAVREQLTHFGRLSGLSTADSRTEAMRVLEAVGLADVAKRRGSELSHGMLKRVGFAQTLIGRPDLILLDEPTAGLDPKSARQVKDLIAALAPKTTVVLSSHNLADVQELCTHGAILDHGRLVASGTIDVLTRRGQEVTIEVENTERIPMPELRQAFGPDNVRLSSRALVLRFAAETRPAEAINRALSLLLAAEVPIVAVQPGTSLERAFLEATAGEKN